MCKSILRAAFIVTVVLFGARQSVAGLTVTLTVNNTPIALEAMYQNPNSGTPDNNSPSDDGFVAVKATRFDLPGDSGFGGFQLFIDSLFITSEKSATQGKVTTINISARLLGAQDAEVVLTAFDDFAEPDVSPLLITSAFQYAQWSSPGAVRPITLTSYLDGQGITPLVATGAGLPTPISEQLSHNGAPYQLKSEFKFNLAPNGIMTFMAESIATGVRTAVVPELASLAAWGCLLGLAGIVYVARRGFSWARRSQDGSNG